MQRLLKMSNRLLALAIFILISSTSVFGQNAVKYTGSFFDYQRSFKRPAESMARKEQMLKTLFEVKGLKWPARYMYVRSFKYDSNLEVWVKNSIKEPYKLLKIYKVCALVGSLGPKRFEGDYQVPEGFYYINEFNPNSSYYLSLGLNYPNASDRILSDQIKPGGDIYIHGGCATVGCIPIRDEQIDELYILAASAKSAGLDFIPVHIFPIKYDIKKSYEYLGKMMKDNAKLTDFNARLEQAFDYFEKYKQVPIVMIKDNGEYVVNGAAPVVPRFVPVIRKSDYKGTTRNIAKVADAVAKWPEYPGGTSAYEAFLKQTGEEMLPLLPEGVTKAYIQVEYIIDTDGTPVNFKVVRGGVDDYVNAELMKRLEKMQKWQPAMLQGAPVAKKMSQAVAIQ